jgi:hypothetical protein
MLPQSSFIYSNGGDRRDLRNAGTYLSHPRDGLFHILIACTVRQTVAAYKPTHNINVSHKFITELLPAHYS